MLICASGRERKAIALGWVGVLRIVMILIFFFFKLGPVDERAAANVKGRIYTLGDGVGPLGALLSLHRVDAVPEYSV